ncbi:bifunctional pyrimidine biosynthesis protein, putative [Babesia caballi]|uniref:Bifunctional pyrimidine biosynthesis protein, putative n=1 Tax=Babesia caballi TaxID=5871 RepID=A0AAV4LP88_BABCB|nr:bifunctional pyrimidine biosynthesis protein, putative [Babesia caballi]
MSEAIGSSQHYWRPEGQFALRTFDVAAELSPGPPAKLLLKDGTEFHGYSFGYVDEACDYGDPGNVATTGEIVFSTAMVGYAEALTDPSFLGQILVMTYPSMGNTGIPSDEQDEFGFQKWFESTKIHVRGLVCCDYTIADSHWTSRKSLAAWIREARVPAIAGIDTRALTKHLRTTGSTLARIIIGPASTLPPDSRLLSASAFYDTNSAFLLDDLPRTPPSLFTFQEVGAHRYVSRFDFTEAELVDMLMRDPGALHVPDASAAFASKLKFSGYPDSPVRSDMHGTGEACGKADHGDMYGCVNLKNVNLVVVINCGIKSNIMRLMLRLSPPQVRFLLVPHDFDFTRIPYDGLVISNGPGDPNEAHTTIANLRKAMERTVPIFGICLGHQLMGIAAGARTYKMRYGHRGFNQPCVDLRTSKCYMTSQNHGFAIDEESLPPDWSTLFVNANDGCVEGIIHMVNPWFSLQFHPEACGGPTDTRFLLLDFIHSLGSHKSIPLHIRRISQHVQWKRILLLSSGGISIGQAGEFDYSGSQAIKALKESGAEVILVNPNVATVQTSHGLADVIYFQPITFEFVSKIIAKERPDGIVCSFGGQTALNCGIELFKSGVLAQYNCTVLGTPIETIINTEDRAIFNKKMAEIGERCAPSRVGTSVESCLAAAAELGYPVLVRTNFALGGFGSGFAKDEAEMRAILANIFTASSNRDSLPSSGNAKLPADSPDPHPSPAANVCVYIDKALNGWKEIEFEIIRDNNDNCVAPASMENFNPLGIHTGDSIVVAPAQTLTNVELYKYREIAFKIVRHLGIVGECNVQFAVDPASDEYFIVELNARLSRSSALASKATGYPLAYVAARIALGFDLVQMRNAITLVTTACFEPSLDYVVVKIPKWDLKKFEYADTLLGSSMKSVGEVMSIGRTFEEAMQKALRMAGEGVTGFNSGVLSGAARDCVVEALRHPTPDHVAAIARAFELGMSVAEVHSLTCIDPWFLHRLHYLHVLGAHLAQIPRVADLASNQMLCYKIYGFSDRDIAHRIGDPAATEDAVREHRKSLGVLPVTKVIDTLAAEYPAKTNYCYMTYNGIENDVPPCNPVSGCGAAAGSAAAHVSSSAAIVVLGCGAYRIGSSIEFDWSAVSCVKALRSLGYSAVIVNCNPETVSTDYDVSDRLYFEELTAEVIDAIYQFEAPKGIVISVGGQTANNLACKLHSLGLPILGTSVESIDRCENRNKFSQMCDVLGIDQPSWEEFTSLEAAKQFCMKASFPVLVRPSYVLSGASMRVIVSFEDLERFLQTSAVINREHPVVISKFIENAKEVEVDCVASQGIILNYAISEHVEYAGTHSGDATLVLPAQNIFVGTHRRVKKITQKLSRYLNISGPFNVQYLCKNNEIKIIECNLRASRTFPFISKALNVNFIDQATRVMVGASARVHNIQLMDIDYVAVKMPVFSFDRLYPSDPLVGVDMKSTGEVVGFGLNKYEALLKAMLSSGMRIPSRAILISCGSDVEKFLLSRKIEALLDLGFDVYATEGTYNYIQRVNEAASLEVPPAGRLDMKSLLSSNLLFFEDTITGGWVRGSAAHRRGRLLPVFKPSAGREPSALTLMKSGEVDMFVNVASRMNPTRTSDGYLMRRAAVDNQVTLITSIKLAVLVIDALVMQHIRTTKGKVFFENKSHQEYVK